MTASVSRYHHCLVYSETTLFQVWTATNTTKLCENTNIIKQSQQSTTAINPFQAVRNGCILNNLSCFSIHEISSSTRPWQRKVACSIKISGNCCSRNIELNAAYCNYTQITYTQTHTPRCLWLHFIVYWWPACSDFCFYTTLYYGVTVFNPSGYLRHTLIPIFAPKSKQHGLLGHVLQEQNGRVQ